MEQCKVPRQSVTVESTAVAENSDDKLYGMSYSVSLLPEVLSPTDHWLPRPGLCWRRHIRHVCQPPLHYFMQPPGVEKGAGVLVIPCSETPGGRALQVEFIR